MSNNDKTAPATASNARDEVLRALTAAAEEMSAAQVAEAAGIGRSTATKTLAALADEGRVARTAGGRDGARRLPDRWAMAAAPATAPTAPTATSAGRSGGARTTAPTATTAGVGTRVDSRLRPGELSGQVLAFLREYPGEHSPSAVAAGLGGRSGGAVSNALARLVDRGQATLTQDRPRRYMAVRS